MKTRAEYAAILQKRYRVLGRFPAEKGWHYITPELVENGQPRAVTDWAILFEAGQGTHMMANLLGNNGFMALLGISTPRILMIPCESEDIIWDVIEVSPPGEPFEELRDRLLTLAKKRQLSDLETERSEKRGTP